LNPADEKANPIGDGHFLSEDLILDEAGDAFYRRDLVHEIGRLLAREFGAHGVLSLSARWNSPLMWSHYADQHQGLCIEYDTSRLEHPNLQAVNYEALRSISVTDLLRWKVDNSPEAEARVRDTYFLSKAADWKYEEEWRYIYWKQGVDHATLKVTGIYFGVRCPPIVRSIFVRILPGGTTFREVFPKQDSFELESRFLDPGEEVAMAQGSSAYLDFAAHMEIARQIPGDDAG
jgi:hypothetical protein